MGVRRSNQHTHRRLRRQKTRFVSGNGASFRTCIQSEQVLCILLATSPFRIQLLSRTASLHMPMIRFEARFRGFRARLVAPDSVLSFITLLKMAGPLELYPSKIEPIEFHGRPTICRTLIHSSIQLVLRGENNLGFPPPHEGFLQRTHRERENMIEIFWKPPYDRSRIVVVRQNAVRVL